MTDDATHPGLVQIGETLRAARENRALSLDQAAARLRCDVRVVECLEAGRFADVGPPVFARGHLLRYAELLDEPGEAMVSAWAQLADGASAGELMAESHPRRSRDLRLVRRRLVAGTTLLCIAIVAVWGFTQLGARPAAPDVQTRPAAAVAPTPPRDTVASSAAASPAAPAAAAMAVVATRGTQLAAAPAGAAARAAGDAARPLEAARRAAEVAPPVAGGASPPASSPAPAVPAPAPAPTPTRVAVPAAAAAGPAAQLAVTVSAESWLEIYDRRNRRLFFGVARPGALVDVRGRLPLRVVVGNVPATIFELDGRRVEVPRAAMRTRRAATFRVGPDGRVTAWPRA